MRYLNRTYRVLPTGRLGYGSKRWLACYYRMLQRYVLLLGLAVVAVLFAVMLAPPLFDWMLK